ncbi:MAG: DUF58 domain-containing protein [Treponema sp.]|nr:DUF58 domain-containing protein [Treponema sp.]
MAGFRPSAMGIAAFLVFAGILLAGFFGSQIALLLAGTVLLVLWLYCGVFSSLLALFNLRHVGRARIRIGPGEVEVGGFAEVCYEEGRADLPDPASSTRMFRLPGILIRCRLVLESGDGRKVRLDFNPTKPGPHPLRIGLRGAYFAVRRELAFFDALGLFRFAFRLKADSPEEVPAPDILAKPKPYSRPPTADAGSGESLLRPKASLRRSDILSDHRPYVPGDDPRRINWKLYGHGGSLFLREGEPEPPPHSSLTIVVDGQYDPGLYDRNEAPAWVDLLCENALSAALYHAAAGIAVSVAVLGESGDLFHGPAGHVPPDAAAMLAFPFACRQGAKPVGGLPAGNFAEAESRPLLANCGFLVLALPRGQSESSLELFLKKTAEAGAGRAKPAEVRVLFLCGRDEDQTARLEAAELNASMLNRRPGVKTAVLPHYAE